MNADWLWNRMYALSPYLANFTQPCFVVCFRMKVYICPSAPHLGSFYPELLGIGPHLQEQDIQTLQSFCLLGDEVSDVFFIPAGFHMFFLFIFSFISLYTYDTIIKFDGSLEQVQTPMSHRFFISQSQLGFVVTRRNHVQAGVRSFVVLPIDGNYIGAYFVGNL